MRIANTIESCYYFLMIDKPSIDDLKQKLSPEEYRVLVNKDTEAPYSGKFHGHDKEGVYVCKCCGKELFSSETKSDSHIPGLAGRPGFDDVLPDSVELLEDNSAGMIRTEVVCKACGCHLGHLFDVGAHEKTGKHYCINSCSLDFRRSKRDS